MTVLGSSLDVGGAEYVARRAAMLAKLDELAVEQAKAVAGGGAKYVERHRKRGKLLARERIELLLDEGAPFLELSPLAAWGSDFAVGASLVSGIGVVEGVECLIVASDPTVRGGASNPWTVQKSFRAADIALRNRLPLINLVESGGADLPTQKEIFIPGGRMFRDLTRLSAAGVPTIALVFGNSTAGGAYLPGMSDYVVMVKERAKVFLGGPPLVKMATGEESDDESLGGAEMHARQSGLADYMAVDEHDALRIGRRIVARLNWRKLGREPRPSMPSARERSSGPPLRASGPPAHGSGLPVHASAPPAYGSGLPARGSGPPVYGSGPPAHGSGPPVHEPPAHGSGPALHEPPVHEEDELLGIVPEDLKIPFDPREVIARLVDGSDFDEFKPLYGASLVTGWAALHGYPIGILANARGVLFGEEAQKAAQFIQLANATGTPLLFLQNTTGYMVGKEYEQGGIIKHGAMMINAVSNSRVPHLTVVMGASYGAGNYGMCGRAYDPRFLFSWPSAKSAVMGPAQLAGVLSIVGRQSAQARGLPFDEEADAAMREMVEAQIEAESLPFFLSGRLYDDGVIDPRDTRTVLGICLSAINNAPDGWNPAPGADGFGVFRL